MRWVHKAVVALSMVFAGYTLSGMCWSIHRYRVECARADRLLDDLERDRMRCLLLELEDLRRKREDAEVMRSIEPVDGDSGWYRIKAKGLRGVK